VLEMRLSARAERLGRVLAEDLAEDALACADGIKVAPATREGCVCGWLCAAGVGFEQPVGVRWRRSLWTGRRRRRRGWRGTPASHTERAGGGTGWGYGVRACGCGTASGTRRRSRAAHSASTWSCCVSRVMFWCGRESRRAAGAAGSRSAVVRYAAAQRGPTTRIRNRARRSMCVAVLWAVTRRKIAGAR
jgi:hypothetical protein